MAATEGGSFEPDAMRLADFILRNFEDILKEWETALGPAGANNKPAQKLPLRHHAGDILRAVAADLSTPPPTNTALPRYPTLSSPSDTAARAQTLLQARADLDIHQMCAEFRALRAGVLRLWVARCPPEHTSCEDMLSFNEAIDQALIASIEHFDHQIDDARNLLLGALGHDLRNPLDTIQITAAFLARINAGEHVAKAAQRLKNSSARMKALLDDLLDYNRSTLGVGLSVTPQPIDLADTVETELQQLRATHHEHTIELNIEGDTRGVWDAHRIQQLLGNLVGNAIKYGDGSPIQVCVYGCNAHAVLEVRNQGPIITIEELNQLFEPLKRGSTSQGRPESTSLGLGLYIAREIVRAHDGHIEARHTNGETVFAISLPKAVPTPKPNLS